MMADGDKSAFAAALAELALLKRAELTQASYAAWWRAMRFDWTIAEFRRACEHLAKSRDFFPNPYHFERLRATACGTAASMWTAVLANLRRGEYRNGITIGGRTDRVIAAMGGYAALGLARSDELHFRERRFSEIWDELAEAESSRDALPEIAESRRSLGRNAGLVAVAELLDHGHRK